MNRLLFILLLLLGNQTYSQSSDVVVLKKRNKTIKRYFAGMDIDITTNTGAYISANITQIKNDSLFLKQFVVQQMPTQLGVYVLDTITTYYYKYHYNQIHAIGKTGRRFDFSASAASLFGGGLLLTVAGGVVYLVDKEKFSPALMIASASLMTIGYVMARTGGKGMVIGKKYYLVYLGISDNKKM
jgi:succinate dehydrogenase/fumarate reductase flavoprotein subunit